MSDIVVSLVLAPSGAAEHNGTCHRYKKKVWEEAELKCANGFGLNLGGDRKSRMEVAFEEEK